MVKCIDTDENPVQVKDLHLLQGQGQNLSLRFLPPGNCSPPFHGWDNLLGCRGVFREKPTKNLGFVDGAI